MPQLVPVDHDPFAEQQQASSGGVQTIPGDNGAPTRVIMQMGQQEPKLIPVDHDPFVSDKPNIAADTAKSLGIGVVKGGIGMAGAPGDVREFLSHGVDYAAEKLGISKDKVGEFKNLVYQGARFAPVTSAFANGPTSGEIQKTVEGVTGDFYKPQTKAGEYAQTVGEFAPALFGGEAALLPRIARTVIPALSSEAAGQATKGTKAEPYARFGGALLAGGATALASRPSTAARALHGQLPEGITPQHVDQAEALINQAKSQGIDLAWPEALSQVAGRPVLTNTMRHLEASPQTESKMAEFFGQRPQQIENAARGQFDNISPVNNAPSSIGPAAGKAANETLHDVRGLINKASDPYYKQAEGVLLTPQEMTQVKQIPGYQQARDAIRKDPQLNSYVSHLPDNSVGFLNEVKKQFDQMGANAGSKFNPAANQQVAAVNSKAAEAVKQIGELKSPDYAVALKVQADAREKYLQPLLDGPLGNLAKKDVATKDAINALFPKNPLPNSEHEINVAVSALTKRNQKAATDLVRAHVESAFNEAAKDLPSGANQAGGAKFRTQLIGNAQQRANLREAVEALPNGSQRWNGFNKFLDVLEATGTRQNEGSRTAYNAEMLKQQSTGGLVADAIKTGANPARFGQKFIDRYEQYKLGKNLGQLAGILTDPRSGDLLRTIANSPVNSDKARAAAIRLISYYGASNRSMVQ